MPDRRGWTSFLFVVGFLALTSSVRAQAWLPPAGEAYFSLSYGNVFITEHYLGTPTDPGDNVPSNRGHIRSQSVGAEVGYAITNRWEVAFGLPFVDAKWYQFEGAGRPHDPHIDNGEYHGTFQDYHLTVLFQLVRDPVALTPFVSAVIPSHDYQYFAHAAAGRDLREYTLGFNIGGNLDRLVPGAYVQARYSYAFVEKVFVETIGSIRHDRSNG